jgi:thiamine biosynthesis lipoprotein ApbE
VRRARSTCKPARRATTATARWEALGSTVVLRVTEPLWLPRAAAILARELDAIDRACSRFRRDSDLTRVNAYTGGRPVAVAPLLVEALQVALRAAELTDGDVDPTVGAALVLAGYDRDFSLLEQRQESDEAWTAEAQPFEDRAARAGVSAANGRSERPEGRVAGEAPADGVDPRSSSPPTLIARRLSGHRTVQLDTERSTVRIPSGIVLDLGATAKAWAADRGARAVWAATRCGVLVSLGGDIATAGAAPAEGWRIHVTDDHRSGPDAPGQTVAIADGGLATSSVAVRRWCRDGQAMHHIIDPSSGAPAGGPWRTVSVAAADCTDANIAATAALVRGRRAPAWLDALGLPARLVAHDGAVLRIGDWPLDGVTPTAVPDRRPTALQPDPTVMPPDRTAVAPGPTAVALDLTAVAPNRTPASVVGHGGPTPEREVVSMRRADDLP